MIHSMTGYAIQEIKGSWGNAIWEIRTLNQRYLETYIRMPEEFRVLESSIRQYIRNTLNRGKIECYLKFHPNDYRTNKIIINSVLINNILKIFERIKSKTNSIHINFIDLLKWPGIVEIKTDNVDILKIKIFTSFKAVIKKIIKVRADEGSSIKKLIQKRLYLMQEEIVKIRIQIPKVLKSYKEKLILKLQEFNINIDDTRLEQEILLLMQKSDITEELDRINIHITETIMTFNCLYPIGRRLDFIMQELNRETNTIASKSTNSYITSATIEMKVLIEQIREQIQNIE